MTTTKEKTYFVSGMHCASCARKIENKLQGIKGVEVVSVSFATGKAVVRLLNNVFNIVIPCLTRNLYRFQLEAGMTEVVELFNTLKAVVHGEVEEEELKKVIEDLGYKVESGKGTGNSEEVKELRKSVIFAGILSVPIFLLSMFFKNVPYREWIIFLLATPIQFYSCF